MSYLQTRSGTSTLATFPVLLALLGGCAASANKRAATVEAKPSLELPYAVSFEGVQDVFGRNAVGDAIVVTAVHGTAPTIVITGAGSCSCWHEWIVTGAGERSQSEFGRGNFKLHQYHNSSEYMRNRFWA